MYSLAELKDLINSFKEDASAYDIEYVLISLFRLLMMEWEVFMYFRLIKKMKKNYWIDTENVGEEWQNYENLAAFLEEMYNSALYCEEDYE